jgi:type IV pilus assembly protein PilW
MTALTPARRPRRAQAGMSLVEVMVVLGITMVVLGVVATVLFSSTRLSSRTSQRADIQGGSRQALAMMTTELRQAGADPSIPPVGVVAIVYGDSVTVHVRSDLNGDGVLQTTEPSEDVTYSYSAASRVLSRDPGTGAVPYLNRVSGMRLTYFDNANTPILALPLSAADAARVNSIGLQLTVVEGQAQPMTMSTRVSLRNR